MSPSLFHFALLALGLTFLWAAVKALLRSAFLACLFWLVLAVLLIPAAFFLGRNTVEVFLLVATVILVLVVELLNSAIEALADALSVETHPLLGRAKDLGSAAVMLMLLFTVAVWAGVAISRYLMH
ncbi:hypothetical protein AD428_22500 [Achromobacter sp. DMS1]|nr:hypothetical protein AD428_22500 [Achromobacter sp. DMS1]